MELIAAAWRSRQFGDSDTFPAANASVALLLEVSGVPCVPYSVLVLQEDPAFDPQSVQRQLCVYQRSLSRTPKVTAVSLKLTTLYKSKC